MAENTVNESTEYRISNDIGGDLVFNGIGAVAEFASRTACHVSTMLQVIAESESNPDIKTDALDGVQHLADRLRHATCILADWTLEQVAPAMPNAPSN